ncbi:MAG TPA: GNAT family N-acetyltransferase [Natrialbaceae archaeon]|nr:GNAT family N-acetyltransferase [Natrialbaceae archaeon]
MVDATVRPADREDVSGIQRVARRGWHAAYEDVLAPGTIETKLEEWYAKAEIHEYVKREDVGYFVAVGDGQVLGYASGGPSDEDGVGFLGAIYVDPDHWGEGIGSRLLDRVESFLADRGYERLRFRVLAENDVGTSFYRSRGYEVVEETETELGEEAVGELVFEGPIRAP